MPLLYRNIFKNKKKGPPFGEALRKPIWFSFDVTSILQKLPNRQFREKITFHIFDPLISHTIPRINATKSNHSRHILGMQEYCFTIYQTYFNHICLTFGFAICEKLPPEWKFHQDEVTAYKIPTDRYFYLPIEYEGEFVLLFHEDVNIRNHHNKSAQRLVVPLQLNSLDNSQSTKSHNMRLSNKRDKRMTCTLKLESTKSFWVLYDPTTLVFYPLFIY